MIDEVRNSIDQMYIKQQMIMEYSDDIDLESKYDCFQEGFFKPGSSKELDVFKFENKHILKAIKCFNKSFSKVAFNEEFDELKRRQERGELKAIDTFAPGSKYPDEIVQNVRNEFRKPNGRFAEGFNELEKQFDCKFKIYVSEKQGIGTVFPTGDNIGKLTISKSKGFQLGGLLVTLNINPRQVLEICPADRTLFGQSFVAVTLHEIYHNIVHMMDIRNKRLHADIQKTISSVGESKNVVSSSSIISSFIDRFMNMFNIKKKEIDKKRTSNRLYVLAQIKDNTAAIKKFESDVQNNADKTNNEEEMDKYIEQLLLIKKVVNIGKTGKIIGAVCSILLAGIGFIVGSSIAAIAGTVCMAIMALSMLKKKVMTLFGISVTVKEEYFCDLFAGMYKLPIHLSSFNRQIKLNKQNAQKAKKMRRIDQQISNSTKDEHPLNFDRELTSYRMAKQVLSSGEKLKPAVRKYLQYIVDLHEGIEDIDNPNDRKQAKKLDPEAAKDLKETLKNFVDKTGVVVTESFTDDFINGGEYYGS